MKFSPSDFHIMRRSLLAICASALASAIILYGSNRYAERARHDRHNAQAQLNDARSRLATAVQDQENMAAYAGEYGALMERNIAGNDQRLDWIEGMEALRQRSLVTDFHYSIAPQKPYTLQPPVDSGNFNIRYSEMKLQLDLLHEAQLLDFFDALRAQVKGRYLLEGCTLQRLGLDGGSEAATAARIKAECSGGWITLKNRGLP